MVEVSWAKKLPDDVEAVVVGLTEVSGRPALVDLPGALGTGRHLPDPLALALDLGAKAEAGSVTVLPGLGGPRLVVVGLGDADVAPEQVRRAVGAALRALAPTVSDEQLHVAVALDLVEPELVKAAAEGGLLGAYAFTKIGSEPRPWLRRLTVVSPSGEAKEAVRAAEVTAAAVNRARDWVNQPANLLYPETFAQIAKEEAKAARLTVEVLDEKQLAKDGFGGILAVGGGSARPPRLVRLTYAPRGARTHLALVGKGITFDTGGLNLKPGDSMITMKTDMAGAAAVVAAVRAIAELGLKVKVSAYAPLAENMPSGSAYRPSDVLTMYGGTTVENFNSDAEGRLVMADALVRACEAGDVDLVVDVATLTGACVVALGERTSGVMADGDQTADLLLDAAEAAGEQLWQLPITDEAVDNLRSKVADLRSGGKRAGGALTAAAFLRSFVPDDVQWAHLDIAGPSFNDGGAYDYVPEGATGVGVRTLVALARSLEG